MAVIERVEVHARREILTMIDQPGGSPRERLLAAMKKAFSLLESVPLLKFFTSSDYDLLFRRLPAEQLQAHLASDQAFIKELVTHCQKAGIPIQAAPGQITGLLYPLVLGILHKDELDLDNFDQSMQLLLELVAAYCLGEIELHTQPPASPISSQF